MDTRSLLALLEGLLRERGEEAEKALNELYDQYAVAPADRLDPEAARAKEIEKAMALFA